jgi:hypothetical protein
MQKWCAVLGHYAVAMTAAYKMRPQAVDRATFKEHARLYVLKKALLRPGSANSLSSNCVLACMGSH